MASGRWEVQADETFVPISRETLVVGENVLAIIGINATISGPDFGVIPRLLLWPRTVVTETTTARVLGETPVRVATMVVEIAGRVSPFMPTWTSATEWYADFELDRAATTIEVIGFDGDGDLFASASIDVVSTVFDPSPFQRADVTGDGAVDVHDALAILAYLFRQASIDCRDAADVDDDGRLTVADAIRILLYLYAGGREPARPFAAPGPDPTDDALGCKRL